jgi:hypothetical protein
VVDVNARPTCLLKLSSVHSSELKITFLSVNGPDFVPTLKTI